MSAAVLGAVLAASLLGSLHCAAMCGGFVAVYSAGSRRRLPHVTYHATRLVAYAGLGTVAGALGAALDLAGRAAGIGRIAGALAGGLMVLWALASLMEVGGVGRQISLARGLGDRVVRVLRGITDKPPVARSALLGLCSALLPCGWLYAFAVAAAGTGSALGGATVMAAFWLGTVPTLLGLGALVQTLTPNLRRHVPVLSAALLLIVGLSSVIGRWNLPAMAATSSTARAHELCGHVEP